MKNTEAMTGKMSVQTVIRCLDISEDGALLLLDLPLEPGATHDFLINIEDETVRIRAVARHCRSVENGYQAGVQFVKIDSADERRLRDAIARLRSSAD
ncbi:MAG: PilZ domain-containing protein [Vicinamibacteria bacterium]|nr:PilZ domain-containing protein [Vicinamibacteria bacterium]